MHAAPVLVDETWIDDFDRAVAPAQRVGGEHPFAVPQPAAFEECQRDIGLERWAEAHGRHTALAAAGILHFAADEMRAAATDLTGQGTILLVEDEEGLRALNARGLQSRGYTVLQAGNGVEALEELEKQGGQVDLVVSDVVMPEMDGPTLMKELKRRYPDIKIIFVSGYAEDAFDRSLPDHKQFNFLAKPFTLKQLVTVVKETMAGGA